MQWRLRTHSTEYAVSLLPDGSGLVLDHWGEPTATAPAPWSEPERRVGFVTPADVTPLEYATGGQRHAAFSELLVDRGNSQTGARWSNVVGSAQLESGADGDRFEISFVDELNDLTLTLHIVTSSRHDVIRRGTSIANRSTTRTVELGRAFSAGWNLPLGQRVRVDYLAGRWCREFTQRSVDLEWGAFSIGSRQGLTSLDFSPVVAVSALPVDDGPTRPSEHAFAIALEWSGSWRLQVDSTSVGESVRVSCGLDEDTTTITLLPGEIFTTPDSLGLFSPDGSEGIADGWHTFQRRELARDLSPQHRPVVYNSWMATTFAVTTEHQLRLAEQAARIGVETFVVDDGWFVGRDSDRAGLGDWRPDQRKLPGGLATLADGITSLGMRFGLWVEPECVNPDSDLYRAHPDWVYRAEGRELITVRNQYVLDLGRPDVATWVKQTLSDLLSSAAISYLKWDMNRVVSDGGRPGDPHGRQWSIQHTRNYYDILRHLRSEFPHVTVEACSSGGGRIDNAVLGLSDVVWTSDEVGARDRLPIQHGFLSAYPSHVMSSWVSDDLGHRDRFPTSLGYRFAVSMAGVLGIGSDVLGWGEGEIATATRAIALYKDVRSVIHTGTVRRHGRPGQALYTLEYAGPDSDPRIVLIVLDSDRDRGRDLDAPRVYPSLLRPDVTYAVEGSDRTITRAEAMTTGLAVGFVFDEQADVLVLRPL